MMKFLQRARPVISRPGMVRSVAVATCVAVGALAPAMASASEGDSVVLHFAGSDSTILKMAFGIGLVSLLVALYMRTQLLSAAAGSERMQEVGKAIQDGALAYLRKQVTTMSVFVLILAFGLAALFWTSGEPTGLIVAICFILGVSGSYVSGYTGMLMAVAANMRVAHAASTSPKRSLEIAFRSGGVAGLFTVGIALMGASLILLLGGSHATTYLVGFGFGGSLAALFMRVGGGIFTKAADVGADLVGKVEAGIPEDDPRNPATIADNVGDNVGDCAGMVADVFESYEVTLVAAIVLGAATSAVFDQETWTRLVVFALAVSGLGLLSSLIAIGLVRGSDDPKEVPLNSISRGLWVAGGLAAVFTLIGSYMLMGGTGSPLRTTQIVSANAAVDKEARNILTIRDSLAAAGKKLPSTVTADDVMKSSEGKALGLDATDRTDQGFVQSILRVDEAEVPEPKQAEGYVSVTDAKDARISRLSTDAPQNPAHIVAPGTPSYQTLGDALVGTAANPLVVEKLHFTGDRSSKTPAPPNASSHVDVNILMGPALKSVLQTRIDKEVQGARAGIPNIQCTVEATYPVQLYANSSGKPMLVLDSVDGNPEHIIGQLQTPQNLFPAYIESDLTSLTSVGGPTPTRQPVPLGFASHMEVPWYCFFFPLAFGILMSIVIQKLTDFYVSTNHKPVQDVAGVSNAGPAPMIIRGFAYGAESSVFMTAAIVCSLMFPLFFFPAAKYGGYILSFYGIALVGLGLLTSTAFVLAMDTFGPISDNAQGVYEMSGQAEHDPAGATVLQRLDAAGNTTKALTKGFASATAVIASAALFHSFVDSAQLNAIGLRLDIPEIFLGLMLGGAAPYLFSAFTINAVGRSSFELIHEVRRQFHSDPGIMLGTSKPDYARCVALVTAAAQKELLGPGILAITLPIAVAFGFSIGKAPTYVAGHYYNLTGAEALGGFLAGAILSGQLMAVLLSNSGGLWDNAKKLIEDGMFGGKGSEAHKASVVCDTVGDPFKDTAGPALNPLIKVMNLVALLLAGVIVQPFTNLTLCIITGIAVAILVISIVISQKGSMSDMMRMATEEEVPGSAPHAVLESPTTSSGTSTPKAAAKKTILVEESEQESSKT